MRDPASRLSLAVGQIHANYDLFLIILEQDWLSCLRRSLRRLGPLPHYYRSKCHEVTDQIHREGNQSLKPIITRVPQSDNSYPLRVYRSRERDSAAQSTPLHLHRTMLKKHSMFSSSQLIRIDIYLHKSPRDFPLSMELTAGLRICYFISVQAALSLCRRPRQEKDSMYRARIRRQNRPTDATDFTQARSSSPTSRQRKGGDWTFSPIP